MLRTSQNIQEQTDLPKIQSKQLKLWWPSYFRRTWKQQKSQTTVRTPLIRNILLDKPYLAFNNHFLLKSLFSALNSRNGASSESAVYSLVWKLVAHRVAAQHWPNSVTFSYAPLPYAWQTNHQVPLSYKADNVQRPVELKINLEIR